MTTTAGRFPRGELALARPCLPLLLTLTLRADPRPENERTRRLYDADTSRKSPGHSILLALTPNLMLVTPLPRWKNPAHGLGDDYGSYSLAQPTTLARPPQPQPQPYRGGAVGR